MTSMSRSSHQLSIAFHKPLEASKEGSSPMSDFPSDAGTGFLRRNKQRTKPSQPEFVGTATVNGAKFRLAAWVNEGDDGKYFKITFRPDEQRNDDRRERQPERGGPSFDSQIPF